MNKFIFLAFSSLTLILLPSLGLTAGWEGFFSYDGILLGGYFNGKWISDAELQQTEQHHMHRIWGGENVGLYDFYGWKYQGSACALSEDHPEEESEHHNIDIKISTPDGKQPRILNVQHMAGNSVKTSSIGNAELAIAGECDAMPRKPVSLGKSNPAYVRHVREYIASRGIEGHDSCISQIYRVDVDGDGTDEVLIAVQNMMKISFEKGESLYTTLKNGKKPRTGGYSFLLLRRLEGNGVRTITLAENLPDSASNPACYTICQLADLNGDGKLELIMGESAKNYYAYHVLTLGKKPERILTAKILLQ